MNIKSISSGSVMILASLVVLAGCGSGNSATSTPRTTTASDTAAPAEETAPAQVLPLALNADGLLGGNATVTDYDAGEPGLVSVVKVGAFNADSGTVLFVFRNNTSEGISHVDATATVRDAAGALAANGTSQGTVPAQIPPGGLGLAYIYLSEGGVPDGATFEFKFDTLPVDTSSYNTGDLKVTETAITDGGVIGTAANQTDATMTGPYSVTYYCFDEAGTPVSVNMDYANEDNDVAPAGTVSFSTTFYHACPTFLVGVSGYFNN